MDPLLRQCLVVGAGGFFGAIARFLVNTGVSSRHGHSFPWGTFVINVSGSFVLGLMATLIAGQVLTNPNWRLGVTVGFIGAYTTFSTFEYELSVMGFSLMYLVLVIGSVAAGYGAVWLGIRLGQRWPHP